MLNLFLSFFIFLLGINFASADVSQFVFTTVPQTIKPNTISEKLTIQAQDASGNSFNIPQTGCLQLKTTSSIGEFSSSNTSWNPVSVLTMNKNTANRSFYYKDSSVGTYALTINIALRPETETRACASWPVEEWNIQWTATQNIIISEQQTEQPQPPSQPEPTSDVGSESWPIEPQIIFANAGPDKTSIVGADVYFLGQALGLKKEPLEGVRFLWNFGDGASVEGQNVKHFYRYPGEYIAVLDVSSGKYSASDNLLVKVIPNQLKISEANKDFVKLSNESNTVLDISDWYLRAGGKTFKFPASTLIRANSSLIIPSSNSGLEANNNVELLYPNASLANFYIKPRETTTIVDSKEKEEIIMATSSVSSNIVNTEQVANVITVEKKDFWTAKKWWGLIILMGFLSAVGFLIIRHKTTGQKV